MRILLIDNHEDGVYKCRGELIKRLLQEHEVFISLPKGKYTAEMQSWGCRFEEAEIDRRGTNPISEIKLISYYNSLLDRVRPDVVLTYSIKPNSYAGKLCAMKHIPYIANVTGLGSAIIGGGILCGISLILYRMGLRKAEIVFFQNEFNRDFMIRHGVVKGKSKVIPGSGVNLEVHRFEEYPSESQPITFLTIGRLMKDKGTDELLEAAEFIKKKYSAVEFNLIGFYDGDYQDKVEKSSKEGIVNFFGHQDDVHSFVKNCHAVIHPSYHEGMANALLEASSAGRPVIASDIPGCRETFDDGATGIGFEPRSTEALIKAIEQFMELPYSKKRKMGRAARKKMEIEFDRNIVIDAYLEQLDRIGSSIQINAEKTIAIN